MKRITSTQKLGRNPFQKKPAVRRKATKSASNQGARDGLIEKVIVDIPMEVLTRAARAYFLARTLL